LKPIETTKRRDHKGTLVPLKKIEKQFDSIVSIII
jgi:hypothetical protein